MNIEPIQKVASQLGVPSSTLKRWENSMELEIPKTEGGHFENIDEAVSIFQIVKEMQERGSGFTTISRTLKSARKETYLSEGNTSFERGEFLQLIQNYAETHYTIGQLEAKVEFQKEQLGLSEEQNELLKQNFKNLEAKYDSLKTHYQAMDLELNLLYRKMEVPWWKKVFSFNKKSSQ